MLNRSDVQKILKMNQKYTTIKDVALNTGHTRKTVAKYLKNPWREPVSRHWKTRSNPFASYWEEIQQMLQINPSLQAKTIFDHLREKHPDSFVEGQLRTLQRHIKIFRGLEGPEKVVMFEQEHRPGELGSSDFTHMGDLRITIAGEPFDHLLYHFVLTYSNWEWVRVCSSESFESLRSGLKEALVRLGGAPREHLTDNLSAVAHNLGYGDHFKEKYKELLSAFGMQGRTTQPYSPHENGDVEQRNYRYKESLDQALMLRGSRNFTVPEQYLDFLHRHTAKLNSTRQPKLAEELPHLKALPDILIPDYTVQRCKVSSFCTVRIRNSRYTVPSRLIGEEVEARIFDNAIEIWYAQKQILRCPRLGRGQDQIDYRHLIESLKRKPGAFKNYRYRESLFPTTTLKIVYDQLVEIQPLKAEAIYLEILSLAAGSGQDRIENALKYLLKKEAPITLEAIRRVLDEPQEYDLKQINIIVPDLKIYDEAFGLEVVGC